MAHLGIIRVLILSYAVATILTTSLSRTAEAVRFGFRFDGVFVPRPTTKVPPPTTFSGFGKTFPNTSPFKGTVSYDTNSPSTGTFSDGLAYKQMIERGFTFDVLSSVGGDPLFQVAADNYSITVLNNYVPANYPVPIDYLSIDFNNGLDPTLSPMWVNNLPYNKSTLFSAPLTWDFEAYHNQELPVELLESGFYSYYGAIFAGSSSQFEIRSFSPISPTPGDYNIDGKVDQSDYVEWRKAFGRTGPDYSYADGNSDGIVDGADFVIWRSKMGPLVGEGSSTAIPEPLAAALLAIGGLFLAAFQRRRCAWH